MKILISLVLNNCRLQIDVKKFFKTSCLVRWFLFRKFTIDYITYSSIVHLLSFK